MILGTANFGNEYKGVHLLQSDCDEILDAAWAYGIRKVETAASYGNSESMIKHYIAETSRHFQVYTKGRSREDYENSKVLFGDDLYHWLWHWRPDESNYVDDYCDGISMYSVENVDFPARLKTIEVPWNILDRRHSKTVEQAKQWNVEVIARSVFIRGEAFKMPPIAGLPFWVWCLQDMPDFDDFIVGVDSAAQLSEIVKAPKNVKLVYGDPLDWVAT